MLLALALISGIAYQFPIGQPIEYHLTVTLDGYLPVLGIGEGKATVDGTFEVVGKNATSVTSTLKSFSITFNEGKLPLDLDDAKAYFPDGKFQFTPEGNMTNWDGIGKAAPIRFPGIDVEHLPETLYMPLDWSVAGGSDPSFTRDMSGGKIEWHYDAGTAVGGSKTKFTVTCKQTYTTLEDAANQVVKQDDAMEKVETSVTGKGSLIFDREKGRVDSFELAEESMGKATDLATKKVTDRKLKIHFAVKTTSGPLLSFMRGGVGVECPLATK